MFSGRGVPIFSFKGITTYLHPTWLIGFVILVMYFAGTQGTQNAAIVGVGAILLFVIVTIHEYGHALCARYMFNLNAKTIVLTPLGGIASVGQIKPGKSELYITAAGPATNLVMWLIAEGILLFLTPETMAHSIVYVFGYINFVLLVFNLLPIFPMDGGRLMRSMLYLGTKNPLLSTQITYWGGLVVSFMFLLMIDPTPMTFIVIGFVALIGHAELSYYERKYARNKNKTKR